VWRPTTRWSLARVSTNSLAAAVGAFQRMYPDPVNDPNYTSIASDRHASRVRELLADAVAKGAKVTSCGPGDGRRIVTMQVVTGCDAGYAHHAGRDLQSDTSVCARAIHWTKPFDTSRPGLVRSRCITSVAMQAKYDGVDTRPSTRAAMTINDWHGMCSRAIALRAGSGNSGIGSWRGPEGFRAFSHGKSVLTMNRWFPVHLFRPPYGTPHQRLISTLSLGIRTRVAEQHLYPLDRLRSATLRQRATYMKTAAYFNGRHERRRGVSRVQSLSMDRIRADVRVDPVGLPLSPGDGSRLPLVEVGLGGVGTRSWGALVSVVSLVVGVMTIPLSLCRRSLGTREKHYPHGVCLVFGDDCLRIGEQLHPNAHGPRIGRVRRGGLRGGKGAALLAHTFPVGKALCRPGRVSVGRHFGSVPGVIIGGAVASQFGWRYAFLL